jgi:hypothetical protein
MQRAATLAIDNPPKALVWEDDLEIVGDCVRPARAYTRARLF